MRNKKPLKSIQYQKAEETTNQQMIENTGTTAPPTIIS
jgi:hypothetical protein